MTLSLEDFSNLSTKEKKKTLEDMKKEMGVSGIVQAWNVSRSKVYNLLHDFDIPVTPKKRTLKPKKPDTLQAENQENKSSGSKDNMQPDDSSKFSLYLETQGSAKFINETVQNLLTANNLNGSMLQINISVQEI